MEDIIRITIYDSIFLMILTRMFGKSDVVMGKAPKQEGNKDCGLYAIATYYLICTILTCTILTCTIKQK